MRDRIETINGILEQLQREIEVLIQLAPRVAAIRAASHDDVAPERRRRRRTSSPAPADSKPPTTDL